MSYTSEEIAAKIDAVLDGCGDGQHNSDPGDCITTDPTIDPTSVDTPLGADHDWQTVAVKAWEALTGEPELPGWFDDLTTVGEMARRSGKDRAEVRAALDAARPFVSYVATVADLRRLGLVRSASIDGGRTLAQRMERYSQAGEALWRAQEVATPMAALATRGDHPATGGA